MSSEAGDQGSKGHGGRGVQGTLTNDPVWRTLEDDSGAGALAAALERRREQATAIALQITGDAAEAADLVQEAYLSARRRLWAFASSFLNLVDLVSILPFYVALLVPTRQGSLQVFRVLR